MRLRWALGVILPHVPTPNITLPSDRGGTEKSTIYATKESKKLLGIFEGYGLTGHVLQSAVAAITSDRKR